MNHVQYYLYALFYVGGLASGVVIIDWWDRIHHENELRNLMGYPNDRRKFPGARDIQRQGRADRDDAGGA